VSKGKTLSAGRERERLGHRSTYRLGWVGLGQNFSPSGGFDYVVGFSFDRLQKLTFYMLSIWSVKYSLRYSLSTRVIKYAVRVAIIIGFFTRE